jgi:predicted aconitase
MTKYRIKLDSKTKESSLNFLNFLKNPHPKLQNFQLILKFLRKKRKNKLITVLKSPHVNKKAQEQFQFSIHSTTITYIPWETKKSILLLKKIKNYMFSGALLG